VPVRRHAAAETPSTGGLGEVSAGVQSEPPTHASCPPVWGSHPSQRPEPGQRGLIPLPPSRSLAGAQAPRCPPHAATESPTVQPSAAVGGQGVPSTVALGWLCCPGRGASRLPSHGVRWALLPREGGCSPRARLGVWAEHDQP